MIVKRGERYFVYDDKGKVVIVTTNRRIAEGLDNGG